MITLLWEDDHGGEVRSFGPHVLLVACLADRLGRAPRSFEREIVSIPKRGNGNVVKALRTDLRNLTKSGPVIAVLDSDRVKDQLSAPIVPPGCLVSAAQLFRQKYDGDYRLLLLERNVDSLVATVAALAGTPPPSKKPTPGERDQILGKAAWAPSPHLRTSVQEEMPTFGRLVRRIADHLHGA